METTALIKEVTRRTVNPKSGADPFVLFEIEDGDGIKWTTKRQELALTAHSLVGKMAKIDGTVKQNGNWKNYYLEGIDEAADMPIQSSNGNQVTLPIADTTGNKDEYIWRQTASKVAAVIADDPAGFWSTIDVLMNFYRTGEHPTQEQAYETAQAFTGDDDIPF